MRRPYFEMGGMDVGGIMNTVAGGVMGVTGLVQFGIGMNEMKKLNRQKWEQYLLTSNSAMALNESIQRAKSGYSPEEIAAYQGRIVRGNNTAYNRGINYGGGNLASAVSQGINYANIGAQQEFSLHDAEMHRRNIMDRDRHIAYEQSLANNNTAQAIDIRKGNVAGAQNLINTGSQNFVNSGAALAGSSGQQALAATTSKTQIPAQESPVYYDPPGWDNGGSGDQAKSGGDNLANAGGANNDEWWNAAYKG